MSSLSSEPRFFGIDLKALWREVCLPWQQASRKPPLAWLSPAVPVTLLHATEGQSVWLDDDLVSSVPEGAKGDFVAVELPEDKILRRRLQVPAMDDNDTASAAELEARTHCPFAPHDLVWGHRSEPSRNGVHQIEIVMASRNQVAQYLAALGPRLAGASAPEVWIRSSGGGLPIVLSGYGEARRFARARRWRGVGYVLIASIVVLLGAMAATPTAQLRLRAIEAVHAFDGAVQRTASIARQREALMQSVEKLDALSQLLAGRIEPLRILDKLTQVLPDDTAVQSFKLQGTKVTIAGDTNNASSLLQLLGEQRGLSDVKAPSAATRVLGAAKESYVIEFVVDPQVFGVVGSGNTPATPPSVPAPAVAAPASSAAAAPAPAAPPANPGAPVATFGGRATFGGTKPPAPPAPPSAGGKKP